MTRDDIRFSAAKIRFAGFEEWAWVDMPVRFDGGMLIPLNRVMFEADIGSVRAKLAAVAACTVSPGILTMSAEANHLLRITPYNMGRITAQHSTGMRASLCDYNNCLPFLLLSLPVIEFTGEVSSEPFPTEINILFRRELQKIGNEVI